MPKGSEICDSVKQPPKRRAYLAATNRYITRWRETGQRVPDDALEARQAARLFG